MNGNILFRGNKAAFMRNFFRTCLCSALLLALLLPLAASCAKPEPPAPVEEDPFEIFYDALSSDNKFTSNIGLTRLRDFYLAGSPVALLTKYASSQATINLDVSAAIDRAVFDGNTEYADFITKFLRDATLSLNMRRDPVKRNSVTNVSVALTGQKLAGADIIVENGERFAIRSPELYPTYIALDYADLIKIISDATHNAAIGRLSSDNIPSFSDELIKIIQLTDISADQIKTVTKPLIDKSKSEVAKENITIEDGVPADGLPGAAYKRVSLSLANEDLRQMLTVLTQTAKDNGALLALIKSKYSIIYDFAGELDDLGIDTGGFLSGLPPAESLDSLFQTSFATFESMLETSAGLPIKAVRFDIYLDGNVLTSMQLDIWTVLPDGVADRDDTAADAAGAGKGAEKQDAMFEHVRQGNHRSRRSHIADVGKNLVPFVEQLHCGECSCRLVAVIGRN